jgi:RNA polymerase sigma-70 factor (ECF subfamily)
MGYRKDSASTDWADRLSDLFRRHRAHLVALVARRTGDRDTAAELVQDSFARLMAAGSVGSAEGDTKLLYAIARNATIDHARTVRRRTELFSSLVAEQFRSEVPSAEQAYESRDAMNALVDALSLLPLRTREVFVLRRVEGLSHAEIAARLAISISTVEKHLVRALRHCERCLKAYR